MNSTTNSHESLWVLTVSPTIWALHFLASYVTVAIWCAKSVGEDGSLDRARSAIGVYTALALLGIGIAGWIGYRRHNTGSGALPHDADTPEDRHRFLGFATLLLSVLSAVATIFVASVAIYLENCD